MSGENKHNSFFPPEDSPISVPPAEDAWSLMRQRLDTGMPIMKVKGSWLRSLRWLAPAAVVAGVTVWQVVYKPLRRDTGRVVGERVSVGTGERVRAAGASGTGAGKREGEVGEESGLKPGGGEDSVKRRGSEIVIPDKRGGGQAGRNGVVSPAAGATVKRSGEGIGQAGSTAERSGGGGKERSGGGTRISGKGKGRQREGSEGSRGYIQHERKAQIPPLAFIGSGYDRSSPGSYASLRVAGLKAGKSLLPGKAPLAKGGKEGKGERILAVGVWDGLNFAMNGQTVYRYSSSDGPDLLVDHLPGAYVRMYLGDRVYIDAGVRLYSPQYTQLQRIDSTGGTDTVYNPFQITLKDTVVSLEKLYYTDIPLTVHYRVAAGLYLGGGLQYSRLWDGAAIESFDSQPLNPTGAVSRNGNWNLDLKNDPSALARLRRSDWRVLLDVAYRWKRITLDLRYQQSLTSYVRPGQGGSSQRNSSLQLNLSYDIWRQRRKK